MHDIRHQAFVDRTREVLRTAFAKYDVPFNADDVRIEITIHGKCAGRAIISYTRIAPRRVASMVLKFNPQAIDKYYDDMFENTIPHEVAHLVCAACPMLGSNHNKGWKAVCRSLGGNDDRCHQYSLTPARVTQKFKYVLDNGYELQLSSVRHYRLQRGSASYHYRGTPILARNWVAGDNTPVQVKQAARTAAQPNVRSGISKADIVKRIVVQAATQNLTPAQVVETIMRLCNMSKAGARTYYYKYK